MRRCQGLLSLLMAVVVHVARGAFDPRNQWQNTDENGKRTTFLGDPSPGLSQRTCYHYYGDTPNRAGKEWATTKCTAPFDQVCVAVKGQAELTPYKFTEAFIRGCHFRCPCPDAQPWVEWYQSERRDDRFGYSIKRHWEKICFLQSPPSGYAVSSNTLPFSQALLTFETLPF
jgi:hypothetical protein